MDEHAQPSLTGKMRLEVRSDEAGVVALRGSVKPGKARKIKSRRRSTRVKHSRKAIKVPSVVLRYNRAGALRLTVKLSRSAQRALGRSRDARAALATVAADVYRNQASDRTLLKIRR